jgi:hypothetical protein
MLLWTVQITVISIILIFLVHHIIGFLKNNLTVPKVKDLVNVPTQKYENMLKTISTSKLKPDDYGGGASGTSIDDLQNMSYMESLLPSKPKTDSKSMKNELKSFLKDKLKGKTKGADNGTPISALMGGNGDAFSASFANY